MSFKNKGGKTICVEIIESVMDELRRERKIRMVLADLSIEEYIKLDLSQDYKIDDPELHPFLKKTLIEKKEFKDALCQKVSIIRLGYMMEVLRACHPGKASMLGADAFQIKSLKIEKKDQKNERRDAFARQKMDGNFNSSMGSMMDIEIDQKAKIFQKIEDPVLHRVNGYINTMVTQITTAGQARYETIRSILMSGSRNFDVLKEQNISEKEPIFGKEIEGY